jgi:small basic protein
MRGVRAILFALIGLFLGLAAGLLLPIGIPVGWSVYATVAILAVFSALLGAIRANLEGSFSATEFVSGLLGNAILAVGLSWLGDRLAVPVYLAAVLYFGVRIFTNFNGIRRLFIGKNLPNSHDTDGK